MKTHLGFFFLFALFPFSLQAALDTLALENLIRNDSSLLARYELEKYNEENLFDPALYLNGILAKDGKNAFNHFKTMESFKGSPDRKQNSFYEMAHYYYQSGSLGMAIAYFRKALLAKPDSERSHQARYWLAHTCLQYASKKKSYLDSADSHFRYLAGMRPRHSLYIKALGGIALVRLSRGNFISSGTVLEMAEENDPQTDLGLIRYIQWLLAEKKGDSAKVNLSAALLHAQAPSHLAARLVPYVQLPDSLLKKDFSPLDSTGEIPIDDDSADLPQETVAPPLMEHKNSLPSESLSIQLAAFTGKENALEYLQTLDYMNINAKIIEEVREGKNFYLIRIEGFADRQSAEEYGENNLKAKGISYYLVHAN